MTKMVTSVLPLERQKYSWIHLDHNNGTYNELLCQGRSFPFQPFLYHTLHYNRLSLSFRRVLNPHVFRRSPSFIILLCNFIHPTDVSFDFDVVC